MARQPTPNEADTSDPAPPPANEAPSPSTAAIIAAQQSHAQAITDAMEAAATAHRLAEEQVASVCRAMQTGS